MNGSSYVYMPACVRACVWHVCLSSVSCANLEILPNRSADALNLRGTRTDIYIYIYISISIFVHRETITLNNLFFQRAYHIIFTRGFVRSTFFLGMPLVNERSAVASGFFSFVSPLEGGFFPFSPPFSNGRAATRCHPLLRVSLKRGAL